MGSEVHVSPAAYAVSAVLGICWGWFVGFTGDLRPRWGLGDQLVITAGIGILMGRLGFALWRPYCIRGIAAAAATLYLSAAIFAVAVDLDIRGAANAGWYVGRSVYPILFGLTVSGLALYYWPLAYFSHAVVHRVGIGLTQRPPRVRT
jgi:hypothetical protein